MKLSRLSIQHESPAAAIFHIYEPDNLLRMENTPDGDVLIMAAKDNLNPSHRRTLVHYLKSEGFIPERPRLVANARNVNISPGEGRIIWTFNPSWPYAEGRFNLYTRRLCGRLLLGPAILWLLFMWMVAFR